VFLTCTASRGWALIDRGRYLSMSWTDDWERCSEAGVASVDGAGPNTSPAVEGGEGYCLDDWLPIVAPRAGGRQHRVRRSISKPSELACYICHHSRPVPMADLVRVTGSRWGVEDTFQFTNNRPVWTTTVPHVRRLIPKRHQPQRVSGRVHVKVVL
jgi:hypothetical protein